MLSFGNFELGNPTSFPTMFARRRTGMPPVLLLVIILGAILPCCCGPLPPNWPDDVGFGLPIHRPGATSQADHQSRSSDDRSRLGRASGNCGHTIEKNNGYIRSPGFPSTYRPNLLCEWKIQVPPSKKILIRFMVLDVRGGATGWCTESEDYLLIQDGADSGRNLGIFCSRSTDPGKPSPIVSLSNTVFVIFHSNERDAGKGFLMSFRSVDALEYSDYKAADQLSFKPFAQPTDLPTTPTINPLKREGTRSGTTSHESSPFRPAQRDSDLTTTELPFESVAFGNPSRGPVLYVTQDGVTVVTKTYSLPIVTEARQQTDVDITSPNLTVEKQRNGFSQPVTLTTQRTEHGTELPSFTVRDSSVSQSVAATNAFSSELQVTYSTPITIGTGQQTAGDISSPNPNVENDFSQQVSSMTHLKTQSQATEHISSTELSSFTHRDPSTLQSFTTEDVSTTEPSVGLTIQKLFVTTEEQSIPHRTKARPILTTEQPIALSQGSPVLSSQETITHHQSVTESKSQPLTLVQRPTEQLTYQQQTTTVTEQQGLITQPLSGTQFTMAQTTGKEKSKPWDFTINLDDPSGELQSPNYPDVYPMGILSNWNITVGPCGVIVLNFTDFDLDSVQTEDIPCDEKYAYVMVEDGSGLGPKHIFCGRKTPPLVVSSSKTFVIRFFSGYGYGKGFHAHYITQNLTSVHGLSSSVPVCGGTFYQPSGRIQTPDFLDVCKAAVSCKWKITVETGRLIVLNFTAFDLDSMPINNWCSEEYDHVKIEDGFKGSSYTYCGQELPPVFLSSSNTVGITFVSKFGSSGGFSALYTVSDEAPQQTFTWKFFEEPATTKPQLQCGGNRHSPRGVIQSPVLSEDSTMDIKCQWYITAPADQVIYLLFTDFNMDSSVADGQCDERYSHVEIVGGSGSGNGWKQLFCGTEVPPLVVSSSNTLAVIFFSGYGYGVKFRAVYVVKAVEGHTEILDMSTSEPLCGGSFHQPNGRIQSPYLTSDSEVDISCFWEITLNVGKVISIEFTVFDLDSVSVDDGCSEEYDHVKIEDGFGGNSYIYCGQELPPVFISTSNRVGITFFSKLGYSEGFSALYKVTEKVLPPTASWKALMQDLTTNPLQPCGGNLDSTRGVIQSPVLSEDDAMDIKCHWNIIAPADQIIDLIFTDFNMDSSVADGHCNGRYSHVEVVGASSTDLGQKLIFCGTEIPPQIVSSSNTLAVTFNSGFGYGMRFRAEYVMHEVEDRAASPILSTSEPLCGGSFHQPSGSFQSPNVYNDSETGISCYWNITMDAGQVIAITFTAFDLDSIPIEDWCDEEYDHLKIEDGLGGKSYTYCGQELPPVFVSISNTVGITFVSKMGYSGGFSAFYKAVEHVLQDAFPNIPVQDSPKKKSQKCGGNLKTPRGNIQSPLLTKEFSVEISCQWNITVPVGQIILLNFTDFIMDSLVGDDKCDKRYSHVEVDGVSGPGGQKQVFCGTENPPLVASSSNALTVTFVSGNGYGVRFRAEYIMKAVEGRSAILDMSTSEPLCGGSFHQPSGRIQSPQLTADSEVDVSCFWEITANVGKVISIEFTAFNLDSTPMDDLCSEDYDHVKIEDGLGGKSYTYCGQALPPLFVSTGNRVGITFISRLGYSEGFSALYWVSEDVLPETTSQEVILPLSTKQPSQQCGGILSSPSGVLQSPVFSEGVGMDVKCQWNITAPFGQMIVLTFTDFIMDSLVGEEQCDKRYSHVEVDGASNTGLNRKQVFCGSEIPPSVTSSSNTLTLTFVSGYGYGVRFRAEYVIKAVEGRSAILDMSTSEPLCGGSFHQPNGRIQSPQLTADSEVDVSCFWEITANVGKVISIEFTAFDLDSAQIDDLCSEDYDHVKIEDGLGGKSYTYCGQELPPVFVSISNTVGITFVSKMGYSGGFSAFYKAVEHVLQDAFPNIPVQDSPKKKSQKCGGNLKTPRGNIQSPLLTKEFSVEISCQWNITVPVGQIILLNFTDFIMDSLVGDDKCDKRYSHVEVDGVSGPGGQKQVFCGTENPPLVASSSNALTVTFVSGNGYGVRFRAEYIMKAVEGRSAILDMSTSEPLCGGSFHQPSGRIQSPQLTADSEVDVSCFWEITANVGKVISIEFTAFNLDSTPMDDLCSEDYDHVKIEDGLGGKSYTYCGQALPPLFVSTGNRVGITFISRLGYSEGFSALYWVSEDVLPETTSQEVILPLSTKQPSQQCGGILSSPSGVLQSPVFSEGVGMDVKCQWNITAPFGQMIVLTFTDFIMDSLVGEEQCDKRYSHVEVDGASNTGLNRKQVFCGSEIPPSVTSSSNTLTLTFVSGYGYGVRFRAEYVIKAVEGRSAILDMSTSEPLCGGSFHQPNGRIQSPQLTADSEVDVSCFWEITANVGKVISIEFTAFDLDSAQIDDLCSEDYDHVKIEDGLGGKSYTYCGQELPPLFVSTGNRVGITFVSRMGYSEGFSAHYWVSEYVLPETTSQKVILPPSTKQPSQQCGGILSSPSGVLQSPVFSEGVGMDVKCQWNITAPFGQMIVLTFTDFIMDSLVGEEQCDKRYSHVEVDGASNTGLNRKQVFCGSEIPPSVTSSSNTLTLTFVSGYGYGVRFRAEYVIKAVEGRSAILDMSTSEPLCGGSFHQPNGRIQSPQLTADSEVDVSCFWEITANVGEVVFIKFTTFDLDSAQIDDLCSEDYDHVKIKDGLGGKSYTYCGQELPPLFVSTSNQVGITFISRLGYSEGFSAIYWVSEDVLPETTSQEVILPPSTKQSSQQCGGILSSPSGVLQSPVFSEGVGMDVKCQWNITAPFGQMIVLTFTDFIMDSLVGDDQCDKRYSHVEVDGASNTGLNWKQVFCGSEIPPSVTSSSNTLTLTFVSGYGYGVRFRAEYITKAVEGRSAILDMSTSEPLCGGSFHQPSGRIQSPQLTTDSEVDVSCFWEITANVGEVVFIKFTTFDLDSAQIDDLCSEDYDHVKIKDGLGGKSYTYCGQELPPLFVSTSNQVGITFISRLGYSEGFSALYWVSEDVLPETTSQEVILPPSTKQPSQQCGGILSSPSGVLQSPVFSEGVGMDVKCQWNITAPVGQMIVLTFTDFIMDSLVGEEQCDKRYSHVEVDGASNTGLNRKQVFCGSEIPPSVTSSSNTLTLTFVSGYGYGVRFRAEYVIKAVEGRSAILDMSTSEPLCGGSFHQPNGRIQSPQLTADSEVDVSCFWEITANVGKVISIEFTAFDLDSAQIDDLCSEDYDHVKIEDGLGGKSYTYCGQELPPLFVSTGNRVGITFVSRMGYSEGFSALYWVSEDVLPETTSQEVILPPSTKQPSQQCGGILSSPSGVLQSPVFSEGVGMDVKCQWNITAPFGQMIVLTFTDFIMDSLVGDDQCDKRYSHVEVDGASNTGLNWKQVFCGSEIPPSVTSSSNTLTLTFVSGYGYGVRFRAEYITKAVEGRSAILDMSTSEPLCGGSFHQPSGRIQSPQLTTDSEVDVSCFWEITANVGEVVFIKFTTFDLDSAQIDDLCSEDYDHVKIKDGLGGKSYTYCGQELPPLFVSTSNQVGITFISRLGYSEGFSAIYWVSEDVLPETTSQEVILPPSTKQSSQQCGGILSSPSGVLQSPVFSEGVGMDVKCQWNITAPFGQMIVLTFTDFIMDSLVGDDQCDKRYSHVEVDGASNTGLNWKQVFCGSEIPPSVTSSSNTLTLTFVSGYGYGVRFRAEYITKAVEGRSAILDMSTSEPLCGGSFHQPSGRIQSPQLTTDSEVDVSCFWEITANVGEVVFIKFTTFDLDSAQIDDLCSEDYDHVKIKDGLGGKSYTYCGQELPPLFVSTSNQVGITFISRLGYSEGFSALYWVSEDVLPETTSQEVILPPSTKQPSQQCGGILSSPSGVLQSPVFSEGVGMDVKCQWNITAPVGQMIVLTFTDFIMDSLVGEEQCDKRYSHVEVDGASNTGLNRKQVFCGSEIPPSVTSSSNTLTLTFVSGYGYGVRFRAEYVIKAVEGRSAILDMSTSEPLCGGSFHQPNGRIQSPQLTADSEVDVSCFWEITANVGKVISIEFTAFDLDSAQIDDLCSEDYDHVKIEDGLGGKSYTYCGQELPPLFVSTSNQVGITFISRLGYSEGFSALYWVSEDVLPETTSQEVILPPSTKQPSQQCGGILSSPSGVLQSPVFSEGVGMDVKCQWNITAPVGQMIVLTFTDFIMDSLVGEEQCDKRYSHVEVDGASNTGLNRKQVFCGSEIPPSVTSSSNTLTLTFVSGYGYGVRFRAEYVIKAVEGRSAILDMLTSEPLCGGSFHQPNGRIQSPQLTADSEVDVSCFWEITANVGKVISIEFTAFDLDSAQIDDLCSEDYDHVKIEDGLGGKSYTYCGQELPPLFVSTGNRVGITFVSRMGYSEEFSAHYWVSEYVLPETTSQKVILPPSTKQPSQQCGGILSSPSGVLQSPVFSEGVGMDVKCQWNITAPFGQMIVLTFTDFIMDSLVGDDQCDKRYSHVEVDGASNTGLNWKQVFCGSEIPPSVTSSSNTLTLTFVSGYGYGVRFRAEYITKAVEGRSAILDMSTSEPLCGGSFHQPSGRIQSPQLTADSEVDVSCFWEITANVGEVVLIKFTTFDLDSAQIDDLCSEDYDHVKIKDGLGGKSYTYCGQELPPIFVSTGNRVGITFVSRMGYSEGFSALYWVSEDVLPETTSQEVILPPSTKQPSQQCGGILSSPSGVLQSPVFSEGVGMDVKCQWNITAPFGQMIVLTFTDFIMDSLVGDDQCDKRYSHVEVDGASNTGLNWKQVFCGSEIPPSVTSSSNTLTLTFVSGYGYGVRFRAEYITKAVEGRSAILDMSTSEPLCGGSFHQPNGRIQSPQLTADSEVDVSCFWEITANVGKVISIEFTAFDLDSAQIDDLCSEDYDHVKIEDGLGGKSYTYCGQELPPLFVSTGNRVGITFVSRMGYSEGFSAHYWVSEDVLPETTSRKVILPPSTKQPSQQCGGILSSPSGVLQSPVFSVGVGMDVKCQWNITAPFGQMIVLTFTEFIMDSLVGDDQCDKRYSHVEVDGASNTGLNWKQVFCGSEIPPSVTSSSNTLTLTFVSGYGYGVRFRAEYITKAVEGRSAILDMSTSEPLCGGSFHQPSGRIQSPQLTTDSEVDVSCFWEITANVGEVVFIKFTTFDLDSAQIDDLCSEDYDHVKIKDGLGGKSYTYCGQALPPLFVSTSNQVGITFISRLGYSEGFSALYWVSEDVLPETTSQEVILPPSTKQPSQQCGGILSSPSGVLQSPVFSEGVGMDVKCQWNITAPVGQMIVLTFTDFIMDSLVGEEQCDKRYSHVEVDGASNTGLNRKQVFCGSEIPPSVTSSSNTLTLTFVSGYGYGVRFRAEYVIKAVEGRSAILDMSTSEPLCGGSFHQPNGRIQSPQLTADSEVDVSCFWEITANVGKVISIEFTAFDLDSAQIDDLCSEDYDHVKIEDGLGGKSYTYCGQELPPLFVSTGNRVGITFVSRMGYSEGFSAHYWVSEDVLPETTSRKVILPPSTKQPSQQCGGILSSPSGVLQSPVFSVGVGMDVKCQWNITAPFGQMIVLTFTEFIMDSLVGDDQCDKRYSHVEVDGASNTGLNHKHVYCGSEIPPSVTSSSNTLSLTFVNGFGYGVRFRAEYITKAVEGRSAILDMSTSEPLCGGSFHQPSGRIQSPQLTAGSEVDVSCFWEITANVGEVISIEFTAFNLDSTPIDDWCSEDYDHVKIDDGFGDKSYTYCSQELPPMFVSSSNQVGITFVSYLGYSGGFTARYSVTYKDMPFPTTPPEVLALFTSPESSSQCGGILSSPHGDFHSLRFADVFETKGICQWNITVAVGSVIVLSFIEFDLDSVPVGHRCDESYAHIKILDQNSSFTFCGHEKPPRYTSSTNIILVHFERADGHSKGFRAHYSAEMVDSRGLTDEPIVHTTPSQSQPSYTTGIPHPCGGNLNEPSGTIEAPNHHKGYLPDAYCRWNITVDAGWVIVLNFTIFELDSIATDGQCDERYAYIKIVDSKTFQYIFCGRNKPPVVVSDTRTLIVEFYSSFGIGHRFLAEYAAFEPDDDLIPERVITASPSKPTTEKLAFPCGGFLSTPTGEIRSPDITEQPLEKSVSCTWKITVPDMLVIVLTFTDFDLDSISVNGNLCDERYDYVSLTDGETGAPIQLVCGRSVPDVFVSSTNTMVITYITYFGYGRGFSASYISKKPEERFTSTTFVSALPGTVSTRLQPTPPYKCGGNLNRSKGVMQSPDIPEEYVSSVICTWYITARPHSTIVLTFFTFVLDSAPVDDQCDLRYAHVSVTDGRNEAVGTKHVYCGQDLPEVFYSSSNTLIVEFANQYGLGGEFSIGYASSEAETPVNRLLPASTTMLETTKSKQSMVTDPSGYLCGGNLDSSSGVIQFPDIFSTMDGQAINCHWTIRVQVGWVVTLNFTFFNLDSVLNDNQCDEQYAYVKVIDGEGTRSPIRVFCGKDLPPSFVTSTNVLVIIFSDLQGYSEGFHAQFNALPFAATNLPVLPTQSFPLTPATPKDTVCSSILTTASGMFSSPQYPNMYTANTVCSWVITTSDNSRFVALRFLDFDVGNPMLEQNCSLLYSYVRVSYHNVRGIEGRHLLCGNSQPKIIAPRSHQITVDFISNMGRGRGFQAAYQAYDSSKDVSQIDWSYFIKEHDTLTTPQPLSTGTGEVYFEVTAASGIITSPQYPAQFPKDSYFVWIVRPSQGKDISLVLEDVDFDVQADDDGHCNKLDTHLELTIYDSEDTASSIIICQNTSLEDVVSHGELKLEFRSSFGEGQGFKVRYSSETQEEFVLKSTLVPSLSAITGKVDFETVEGSPATTGQTLGSSALVERTIPTVGGGPDESSCDKLLREPEGIIISPNFPVGMPQEKECSWVIQIPGNHGIYLEFLDFALDEEIEPHQASCRQESASVSITMDDELYEFCGNAIPAPMTSSDDMVILVFKSNSGKGAGFRMHYITTLLTSTPTEAPRTAQEIESMVPADVQTTLSPAHTTLPFDIRFIEDDSTHSPENGRDLTRSIKDRVNVPVFPSQEPSTITTAPDPDLDSYLPVTDLEQTVSKKLSFTLPDYTDQPKVPDMASTDSGAVDIITNRRVLITTFVCISVAIVLFVILVILTGVCIYKRRRQHLSKAIVLGQTEKSYWQNYKSWAVDYTGGPGRSSRAATAGHSDDEEEAEDMLKQERLV